MTPRKAWFYGDALKLRKQLEDILKLVKVAYFQVADDCQAGYLLEAIKLIEDTAESVEDDTELIY